MFNDNWFQLQRCLKNALQSFVTLWVGADTSLRLFYLYSMAESQSACCVKLFNKKQTLAPSQASAAACDQRRRWDVGWGCPEKPWGLSASRSAQPDCSGEWTGECCDDWSSSLASGPTPGCRFLSRRPRRLLPETRTRPHLVESLWRCIHLLISVNKQRRDYNILIMNLRYIIIYNWLEQAPMMWWAYRRSFSCVCRAISRSSCESSDSSSISSSSSFAFCLSIHARSSCSFCGRMV